MAEVFHRVGENWRCSMIRIVPPHQSDSRLRNIGYRWLRRRTRKSGRLRCAMENDRWIGRHFNNQCSTPTSLSSFTDRFAGVQTRVRLPKI